MPITKKTTPIEQKADSKQSLLRINIVFDGLYKYGVEEKWRDYWKSIKSKNWQYKESSSLEDEDGSVCLVSKNGTCYIGPKNSVIILDLDNNSDNLVRDLTELCKECAKYCGCKFDVANIGVVSRVDMFRTQLKAFGGKALERFTSQLELEHSDIKSEFNPSVKDLLVQEITVGGDILDRELFYMLTEGKSKEQMDGLKAEVTKDVEAYYEGVARQEGISFEDYCRTHKFIHRGIDYWFSSWNLQGGKMDHELSDMVSAVASGKLSKDSLKWSIGAIAINNVNEHPEFKRNITGWIINRCDEQGISLSELPKPVRKKFPDLIKNNQIKM